MATTFDSVITIDESHPFFLHYGGNLGAILVAQPLVNDNYPTGAKSTKRALGAKSKLGFIDGSLSLTPAMAKVPPLVQAWTKCNNMVVSWILNCVSPKILQVLSTRTQLWKFGTILRSNFLRRMDQDSFNFQKDLTTISQGDLSITDHFTQLKVLWDEIKNYRALPCCTCGSCICLINEKLTQYQLQDSVMQFLLGLNESYSQIQGCWVKII